MPMRWRIALSDDARRTGRRTCRCCGSPVQRRQPDARTESTAQRMWRAVRPFADRFITPMAAVAGAVADEILAAMCARLHARRRAHVNNGGDIALHLDAGCRRSASGLSTRPDGRSWRFRTARSRSRRTDVAALRPAAGGGRSLSLGIADAVTVLARSAAEADAAATMIANAVDLRPSGDRARARATSQGRQRSRRASGDGGCRRPCPQHEIAAGAGCGWHEARAPASERGLIHRAALFLAGPDAASSARPQHTRDMRRLQISLCLSRNPRNSSPTSKRSATSAGRSPAKPLKRGAVAGGDRESFCRPLSSKISAGFMKDLEAARPRYGAAAGRGAGWRPRSIEGYGKGAIVGSGGELEHGALWHVPGGYAMREVLGDAKAIVPSTKKVGAPGHAARRAGHPYQRLLCAQPFRCDGGRRAGRAARRRDRADRW